MMAGVVANSVHGFNIMLSDNKIEIFDDSYSSYKIPLPFQRHDKIPRTPVLRSLEGSAQSIAHNATPSNEDLDNTSNNCTNGEDLVKNSLATDRSSHTKTTSSFCVNSAFQKSADALVDSNVDSLFLSYSRERLSTRAKSLEPDRGRADDDFKDIDYNVDNFEKKINGNAAATEIPMEQSSSQTGSFDFSYYYRPPGETSPGSGGKKDKEKCSKEKRGSFFSKFIQQRKKQMCKCSIM